MILKKSQVGLFPFRKGFMSPKAIIMTCVTLVTRSVVERFFFDEEALCGYCCGSGVLCSDWY